MDERRRQPDGQASGPTVGRFELGRTLGAGGGGRVHEAVEAGTGRRVALKLLLPPDEAADDWHDRARRLGDEARAAALVVHEDVVPILASGLDAKLGPWIAYALMPGGTLRARLKGRGALGADAALGLVARPLLRALAALHEAGIIHRDVKPENLLADERGNFRLGDLGLALFSGRDARTVTGYLVGTPAYLAPERLTSPETPAGPPADLFAAALVTVEAWTGRHPFRGPGDGARAFLQLQLDLTAADLRRLGLPPAPAAVLARALARDPARRHASAAELLAELERAGREAHPTTELRPVQLPSRAASGASRRAVAGLLTVLALGAAVVAFVPRPTGPPQVPTQPPMTAPSTPAAAFPLGAAAQAALLALKTEGGNLAAQGALPEPLRAAEWLEGLTGLHDRLRAATPDQEPARRAWKEAVAALPTTSPVRLMADAAWALRCGNDEAARRYAREAQQTVRRALQAAPLEAAPATRAQLPAETLTALRLLEAEAPPLRGTVLWESLAFLESLPKRLRTGPWFVHHRFRLLLVVAQDAVRREDGAALEDVVGALEQLAPDERLIGAAVDSLEREVAASVAAAGATTSATVARLAGLAGLLRGPRRPLDQGGLEDAAKELLDEEADLRDGLKGLETLDISRFRAPVSRQQRCLRAATWLLAAARASTKLPGRRAATLDSSVAYELLLSQTGTTNVPRLMMGKLPWGVGFERDAAFLRGLSAFVALARVDYDLKAGCSEPTLEHLADLVTRGVDWLNEAASTDRTWLARWPAATAKALPADSIGGRMLGAVHLAASGRTQEALAATKPALRALDTCLAAYGPPERWTTEVVELLDRLLTVRWSCMRKLELVVDLHAETLRFKPVLEITLQRFPKDRLTMRAWARAVVYHADALLAAGRREELAALHPVLDRVARDVRLDELAAQAEDLRRGDRLQPRVPIRVFR